MNLNDFEIMAPVGSRECFVAALQAGADSVYFGIEALNMRAISRFAGELYEKAGVKDNRYLFF